MILFADTSLLCALYRREEKSARAETLLKRYQPPLFISSLVAFEFRQSSRLQVFRFNRDRTRGFPAAEASKMLDKFSLNISGGAVALLPVDWTEAHDLADRLSAKYTGTGGHRSLDILHVASALQSKANAFFTFDEKQAELARSERLKVIS